VFLVLIAEQKGKAKYLKKENETNQQQQSNIATLVLL